MVEMDRHLGGHVMLNFSVTSIVLPTRGDRIHFQKLNLNFTNISKKNLPEQATWAANFNTHFPTQVLR